jgi:predicted GNAT superfamily acetyltransferase
MVSASVVRPVGAIDWLSAKSKKAVGEKGQSFEEACERLDSQPRGHRMSDARVSPMYQAVMIRPAHDARDLAICVELQQKIWGYSAIDTVPEHIFIVAKKTGGQVLVACDGEKAIGFALAFAAMRSDGAYLHSHMVGVSQEYQHRGVGRLLKLEQRADAIARGIDLIEWTFDPLQLKNARFNIARLGTIVRRYLPNLYGRTSSPLHAGLPTDRLVAEWWVRSPRVEDLLSGKPRVFTPGRERVVIPVAIREICRSDPRAAERIQSVVREQFETHISNGCAAVGFEFNEDHGCYILEPYED